MITSRNILGCGYKTVKLKQHIIRKLKIFFFSLEKLLYNYDMFIFFILKIFDDYWKFFVVILTHLILVKC